MAPRRNMSLLATAHLWNLPLLMLMLHVPFMQGFVFQRQPLQSAGRLPRYVRICDRLFQQRQQPISPGSLSSSNTKEAAESKESRDDETLTPEKVAELIEVSFVNGVMQLAQGYVDVLKLFIVAVQAGYALGMSPTSLVEVVAACPDQSANRPLMDDEITLRTTWIQVVYLVLDHVGYKNMSLLADMEHHHPIDPAILDTYGKVVPRLVDAHRKRDTFEAEHVVSDNADILPDMSHSTALETAIVLQSLRIMWLTLVVLDEEAQCIEDQTPVEPRPPIPGAFDT